MVVEANFEQIIAYNCLKVDLMLNLQAVESLKKNILKKYMMVFGVESFGKELYFIATTGRANN
jgi:hypothetical protein